MNLDLLFNSPLVSQSNRGYFWGESRSSSNVCLKEASVWLGVYEVTQRWKLGPTLGVCIQVVIVSLFIWLLMKECIEKGFKWILISWLVLLLFHNQTQGIFKGNLEVNQLLHFSQASFQLEQTCTYKVLATSSLPLICNILIAWLIHSTK